jgi:hypothetical protein
MVEEAMSNHVLKWQKLTGLAHQDRLEPMRVGMKKRVASRRRQRESSGRENLKVPGVRIQYPSLAGNWRDKLRGWGVAEGVREDAVP